MTDVRPQPQPTPTTTTFVAYLRPGVVISEESNRVVPTRSPLRDAQSAPDTAYAFYYFDILKTNIEIDGESVEFQSRQRRNPSRLYYIDGKLYGRRGSDVISGSAERLRYEHDNNGQPLQVLCRRGNLMPFDPDTDELIATR